MNQLVPMSGGVPAMTVSDVERVALAIAKGGLFGCKDPNAVLTLCLLAQAEGQHPAVVFRDYHIISGKPAKKSEAMLRDFINAGGKVEWHKLDDDAADATFTHPSGSARIIWDRARVQQAQLGNNAMYKKYPRQMLRSRVISEGVRTVYPGATSGLYESNEVEAIAEERGEAVTLNIPATEPVTVGDVLDANPGEPKPRQKLAGPLPSKSQLSAAMREFGRSLEGCGTMEDLEDLLADKETAAILEQCARDMPGWWSTGEGCPAEFMPFEHRIKAKSRELQELAELNNRANADMAAQ